MVPGRAKTREVSPEREEIVREMNIGKVILPTSTKDITSLSNSKEVPVSEEARNIGTRTLEDINPKVRTDILPEDGIAPKVL